VLSWWARGTLFAMAAAAAVVFAIAVRLDPYDADGRPLQMETHRQLGLPRCTFYDMTGLPCPSCGMTTSFALLMHGDVWNSLRANAVGTLLAAVGLVFIPWALACAVRGRPYVVWSFEWALTRAIIVFLILMLVRWVIVLGLIFAHGHAVPRFWKPGGSPPADSRRGDDGDEQATLADGGIGPLSLADEHGL
jgi:hypothetical protein